MFQRFTRLAAFTTLLASVACQTWKTETRPVPAVVQQHENDKVAVTMNDLRWVVLRRPTVQGDSVVGTRIAGNTYGRGRTALSLSGVRSVQTKRISVVRTLALGAFLVLAGPPLYKLAIIEEE